MHLHGISHARPSFARFLSRLLRPLLQRGNLLRRMAIPRRAVRLDGLFAVGRELGLPVAGALLLLGKRVLFVEVVVNACFFRVSLANLFFLLLDMAQRN